jgi:hypothetical protein
MLASYSYQQILVGDAGEERGQDPALGNKPAAEARGAHGQSRVRRALGRLHRRRRLPAVGEGAEPPGAQEEQKQALREPSSIAATHWLLAAATFAVADWPGAEHAKRCTGTGLAAVLLFQRSLIRG